MALRQDSAQTLALQALGWLAGQDERFHAFLAACGTGAAEVRARAADPEMLGSVLDFLLADEAALLQFCAEAGLPPETPMQARAALPGGDVPFWT
ncbi:MAG: DUF3572 domain-containing protein [Rhodobacter sp.]|jgi:hypothetical protein|nr:DUF3572 domain-containing protein [Rhodobacter sp.]MBK8439254.1 DUF3572 domain-containing protein [Rhodobacter sp.]